MKTRLKRRTELLWYGHIVSLLGRIVEGLGRSGMGAIANQLRPVAVVEAGPVGPLLRYSIMWALPMCLFGCEAGRDCPRVYPVVELEESAIQVDGVLDESVWRQVAPAEDFDFRWQNRPASMTRFRAFRGPEYLYFAFDVDDEDLVLVSPFEGELDVAREDRIELFFSPAPDLDNYVCLEIDPAGRILDYRGSFYRRFDYTWQLPGLRASGTYDATGYHVEGAIPRHALEDLGMRMQGHLLVGLYRAEFSHTESREPRQEWISWVDPGTEEPDFHVPSSFGCFHFE